MFWYRVSEMHGMSLFAWLLQHPKLNNFTTSGVINAARIIQV